MADNTAPAPLGEGISDEVLETYIAFGQPHIKALASALKACRLSSGRDRDATIDDAERWRALMASQRIRVMGSAGFKFGDGKPSPARDDGYLHMGVEFWSLHQAAHPSEEFPQDRCREMLTVYVDHIRSLKTTNGDKPPSPAGEQT